MWREAQDAHGNSNTRMTTPGKLPVTFFILALILFRIFLGIQVNFSHEDYTQVYLIGLEHAFSGHWSYWGPDVVWSNTRLPGALLGFLAGMPLSLTLNEYAPIILSNIISGAGLILLSFYAKQRFPKLSIYFLLALFLLSPFMLFNGVVLLNTAYLLFSGAILFMVVFELFVYRDDVLWPPHFNFLALGFSLLFTFQLHLSWVMFIPFVFVLFYREWRTHPSHGWKYLSYFTAGCILSGLTLLPTLFKYSHVILIGSGGNVNIHWSRVTSIVDLFVRYTGIATLDVNQKLNFIHLLSTQGWMGVGLIWTMKLFSLIQFIGFSVSFYFMQKSPEFRKSVLLFFLSLLMALGLYILSNKHLEMRTYILLYPIPLWLALFAYSYLMDFRFIKSILYVALVLLWVTSLGIAVSNFKGMYSFSSVETKIEKAIQDKNPEEFAIRRKTLMDHYH